jgi:hypothetical protein
VGSSARWQRAGVFFDNVTIRLVDAGTESSRARTDLDVDLLTGLGEPAANSGTEEFTIAAPIPGCAGDGPWDGKANPMIVLRLFLDSSEPLN